MECVCCEKKSTENCCPNLSLVLGFVPISNSCEYSCGLPYRKKNPPPPTWMTEFLWDRNSLGFLWDRQHFFGTEASKQSPSSCQNVVPETVLQNLSYLEESVSSCGRILSCLRMSQSFSRCLVFCGRAGMPWAIPRSPIAWGCAYNAAPLPSCASVIWRCFSHWIQRGKWCRRGSVEKNV